MVATNKTGVAYRHDPVVRVFAMYAIKLSNEIYHLTQRGGQHTLCGLRISRVTSVQSRGVQLADELSAEDKICKHCERINEQDLGNNM